MPVPSSPPAEAAPACPTHGAAATPTQGTKGEASGREAARLRVRRRVFTGLVASTCLVLAGLFARLLAADGLDAVELALLVLFALNLPWPVVGFWNGLIGVVVLRGRRDPVGRVMPLAAPPDDAPVTTRTAVVMPVHNEDPARVFRHLRTVTATLDAAGGAGTFEVFLLSDTSDLGIAAEEIERFRAFRDEDPRPARLHYRRRDSNRGHKVGNLRDFGERFGGRFDFMLVLDADGFVAGDLALRLVRLMQANPQLGILQSLAVGLPAVGPFARLFQFGMRQGMRAYTVGATWWQGPDGPYWGHNALVRLKPFLDHCRVPAVPGGPPLGGEALSHDQIEAVLMRRAGFEVRVLPEEGGSYEESPPTLPDFIKRELRWCLGNMQYLHLLDMPGLSRISRVQLGLAVLMYAGAFLWFAFMAVGVLGAALAGFGLTPPPVLPALPADLAGEVTRRDGLFLFAVMMAMAFAPKLLGYLDLLLGGRCRAGATPGRRRTAAGALLEIVFSVLTAPVVALAVASLVVGLLFGRRVRWDPQTRDDHAIPFRRALRLMAPPTVAGLAIAAVFAFGTPGALVWAAPVLLGLLLAGPVTALSSRPGLGRALARRRLAATPEELDPPFAIRLLGTPTLASAPGPGRPRRRPAAARSPLGEVGGV